MYLRPFIFLSHTQNNATDPLSFQEKLDYIEGVYGKEQVVFGDPKVKTIVQALQELQNQGRTKVVMVAGDDRLANFKELLNKYNNKPDKSGKILYNFDTIKVTSAGQRDPDAEGLSGVSASKARQYAQEDDFENFSKIVMGGKVSAKIFLKIQAKMGKKVAVNNEKLYTENMDGKPTVYIDMDGVLVDFQTGIDLYNVLVYSAITVLTSILLSNFYVHYYKTNSSYLKLYDVPLIILFLIVYVHNYSSYLSHFPISF